MTAERLDATQRTPVRLRRFRPDDLAAMHDLDRICFRKGIAYSLVELSRLIRRVNSFSVIAESDTDQLAGFCIAESAWRGGVKTGSILTLDVRPECRRRGIGSLLMFTQEKELLSHGVRHCKLEVAIDDPSAQEFYLHLGYRATARISGYYMGKLDALVMQKQLG